MVLSMAGKYIGRYRVDELIGEGGMASVYKAFDTRLERSIAIKVLRPFTEQDADFPLRFEREAKALANMTHANIVKVHDYGDHEGMLYLVMEYLPGGTLKNRLGKPFPFSECARILIPIARALGYAHQRKIVHRDVKPSNILFSEGDDPVISDFGIAKMLAEGMTQSKLTGTNTGIGTPDYMAPEQGLGEKITYLVDEYALGVVLFEMITGRLPFVGETPMAVMLKHVSAPFPRPSLVIPELAGPIEDMILRTTQKKPGDRYQSMEALVDEMQKLADQLGQERRKEEKKPPAQPIRPAVEQEPASETPPSLICPHCGISLPPDATSCPSCGHALESGPLPPTAQRPSIPQHPATEIAPPKRAPGMWQIIITSGPLSGKSTILGEKCAIGRSKENDIQVADTNASRNHAMIEKVTAGYLLTDLNSTNGTSLNGKKITRPMLLQPGDKLVIGDTQYTIYSDPSGMEEKEEKTAPWSPAGS